jgi:hypothetical protein
MQCLYGLKEAARRDFDSMFRAAHVAARDFTGSEGH